MILDKILKYNDIIIQCHDNPDADTIASGYALYTFLDFHQKNVRLIYSGPFVITKPNLKMLVEKLSIPLEYVTELTRPEFLITVDCHYGNSNLTHFDAKEICIIDHHISKEDSLALHDIRPYLGSCSTLIWHLLNCYGFNLDSYFKVRTALYYGLLTDTNFLSEARHPLDRDMAETLNYDSNFIHKLKSSNLSLSDLETAGIALIRCSLNTSDKFAVLESRPCDPNILGFISDLAIQVDSIDTCIVYFKNEEGIKYSLRSCTKEVKANEFAEYVSYGIGSGGGHTDKAGGFMSATAFYERYSSTNIDAYFHNITRDYFNSFDIIYADEFNIDTSDMTPYSKQALPVGCVISTDIFKENTPICIRTLEGDLDVVTSPDMYLLIEDNGQVHPIHEITFNRNYKKTDSGFKLASEYVPIVRNKDSGISLSISYYLKGCIPTTHSKVYAKPLTKNLKVFTRWDKQQYLSGYIDDYLVVREDDLKDIFIEPKEKFLKNYLEE